MNIVVNGAAREFKPDATVLSVIEALGLHAQTIVVQRNDDIVERERFAETALTEGDVLELVRLVGGG